MRLLLQMQPHDLYSDVPQLSCGHRCPQQCHDGVCPSADKCQRKVTIRCRCRRIKKEFRCSEATKVLCDAECARILREQEQVSVYI